MPDNNKQKNSIFTSAVITKGIIAGVVVLAIAFGLFWLINNANPEAVSDLLNPSDTDTASQEEQSPLIDDTGTKDKNDSTADSSTADKESESTKEKENTPSESESTESKEESEKAAESESDSSQQTAGTAQTAQNSAPAPSAIESAPAPSAGETASSSTSASTNTTTSGSTSSSGSSNSNFGYNSYPTTNDYAGHWSNGPYVLIYDTLVHASASTDSTWVANLKPGDVIQVKQVVKAADGKYWGQVENGWVNLAWGNRLYALNPGQPYYFTQNMAIRDNPSPDAKQVGSLPAGSTRMIYTILYRENEEFWGQLEKNKDQWVCLVDLQNFYVTKA